MLGVKGYCCKCGPFRLLRSDLEKKRYFWVVHARKSLTYGKDTKRIIHVAEVVDRVSEDIILHFAFVSILKTNSCSWLHVKYFLQTLVVERKKKVTRLSSVVELVGLQKGKHPPPLPPFYPSFFLTLPKIICIPILLCTVCWVKQNLLK